MPEYLNLDESEEYAKWCNGMDVYCTDRIIGGRTLQYVILGGLFGTKNFSWVISVL